MNNDHEYYDSRLDDFDNNLAQRLEGALDTKRNLALQVYDLKQENDDLRDAIVELAVLLAVPK